MISAHAAKKLANEHLTAEGSGLVANRATRDQVHGVWVVSYVDPSHPVEMLVGGALVVTDDGEVHEMGSAPGALRHLMESLGRHPSDTEDVWSREGEALALLADDDLEEAKGLVAMVASRRPWSSALGDELDKPYFREILDFVEGQRRTATVYPHANDVFAAFHLTAYDDVRVVILGQDPYHQPGQANGLCFSVPRTLEKLPPSLRNIRKAMENADAGPLDHGDLTSWATQGVLLLNTALTVRESEANSHAKEWRRFTDAVIRKLSDRREPVVFVLWGRPAQKKADLIDHTRHVVVTAPHPASRGKSQQEFREGRTFALVDSHLEKPIDWAIR